MVYNKNKLTSISDNTECSTTLLEKAKTILKSKAYLNRNTLYKTVKLYTDLVLITTVLHITCIFNQISRSEKVNDF